MQVLASLERWALTRATGSVLKGTEPAMIPDDMTLILGMAIDADEDSDHVDGGHHPRDFGDLPPPSPPRRSVVPS